MNWSPRHIWTAPRPRTKQAERDYPDRTPVVIECAIVTESAQAWAVQIPHKPQPAWVPKWCDRLGDRFVVPEWFAQQVDLKMTMPWTLDAPEA